MVLAWEVPNKKVWVESFDVFDTYWHRLALPNDSIPYDQRSGTNEDQIGDIHGDIWTWPLSHGKAEP